MVTDARLVAGDSVVGHPATVYPAGADRGLDLGPSYDQVELATAYRITIRVRTTSYIDQVRIITAADAKSYTQGYRMTTTAGRIKSFGLPDVASLRRTPDDAIVGGWTTCTGRGSWLVDAGGKVTALGDAANYGSLRRRPSTRVVGIASPHDLGYYVLLADGTVRPFGQVKFLGGAANAGRANKVAMVPTPSGQGYWIVTQRGRLFTFGDAQRFGSPRKYMNDVVGMATTPSGRGYWIVRASGRVMAFGDAPAFRRHFHGSPTARIVSIVRTPAGRGFWLIARDGSIYRFGDAADLGVPTLRPGAIISNRA
jgi:hypothetical protein